ncbi:MAG: hypothetical protein A4E20_04005 [Nitrospira sp. SG-bin2]|nr:MAG: hypothetical protein A4E20_04005 [Nitrospira sp. SG-bin2]
MLLVESRKKSGGVAALLNLFLPGAGYIYCNNWLIGIVAFFFVITVFVLSFGFAAVFLVLMLVIDGFLCAKRYNKKLIERVIKERAELQRKTSASNSKSLHAVGVS